MLKKTAPEYVIFDILTLCYSKKYGTCLVFLYFICHLGDKVIFDIALRKYSIKVDGWMGWKSLWAPPPLRAPFCGVENENLKKGRQSLKLHLNVLLELIVGKK